MTAAVKWWFGSDFHFGHKNVINFCNRPFEDMAEQDSSLVETWNKYVGPQDNAFILGDFSFYRAVETTKLLQSMNGHKLLVKGNHDHSRELGRVSGWLRWVHYHEMDLAEDRVTMSHFPMLSWHRMHRGAYHLHGHCHGTLSYPEGLLDARILDVGIDHIARLTGEYRPMEWSEIKEVLKGRRGGTSVDHHAVRDVP
jgi:calcineurin-like phosphoesterase family protein